MRKYPCYNLPCLRCKQILDEKFARYSNHCPECLPLVSAKWEEFNKWKMEKVQECDDFAHGRDLA